VPRRMFPRSSFAVILAHSVAWHGKQKLSIHISDWSAAPLYWCKTLSTRRKQLTAPAPLLQTLRNNGPTATRVWPQYLESRGACLMLGVFFEDGRARCSGIVVDPEVDEAVTEVPLPGDPGYETGEVSRLVPRPS
jgi:hypothetical protein